jgi:hypothetical protein
MALVARCLPAAAAAAMTDVSAQRHNGGTSTVGVAARDFASSLRSLLEITRAVRSGADVDPVLDAIARGVA